MSELGFVLRQIRFVNRSFWRNPPAAFFTFVFPLIFLFIFSALFSDESDTNLPGSPRFVQVYVPAIVALPSSPLLRCYMCWLLWPATSAFPCSTRRRAASTTR